MAVAPYVGAWIETWHSILNISTFCVAPYVGAWIETSLHTRTKNLGRSHPMWVRGLKLEGLLILVRDLRSHPMWVRGLKLALY